MVHCKLKYELVNPVLLRKKCYLDLYFAVGNINGKNIRALPCGIDIVSLTLIFINTESISWISHR